MKLKGKNILITGGANGLGKATALKLSSLNGNIIVFDNNEEALELLKKEKPVIDGILCDVSDPAKVQIAVDFCIEKYEKIDILINNAGIIRNSLLISLKDGGFVPYNIELWDSVISNNLSSVFYMTSLVVQKMVSKRVKGLIVNISSISATGNLGQSAYSASKAGVNAFTVSIAKELGCFGIRAAAIAPGFVETKTTMNSMSEKVITDWKRKTSVRRFAIKDEIVEGILFIIRNDFFNGRVLEIDGGLRI